MKVADLYLQKLLDGITDRNHIYDDQEFKVAHAEGACAVFRDLGMMSPADDVAWRRKFRAAYREQLAARNGK